MENIEKLGTLFKCQTTDWMGGGTRNSFSFLE